MANVLLTAQMLSFKEELYPLVSWFCPECLLVQVPAIADRRRIFAEDYPYFSSVSSTWRAHCKRHASELIDRCNLGPDKLVVEIASNDGCLLVSIKDAGVRVLEIEPAGDVARARFKGFCRRNEGNIETGRRYCSRVSVPVKPRSG